MLPDAKKKSIKKTLVFDLDETLIHCVENDKKINPSENFVTFRFEDGQEFNASINIRPHAIECLTHRKETYQLVIFTASH